MDKVRQILEKMFGRELTESEITVLNFAYTKGEMDSNAAYLSNLYKRRK